jgi:type VI secretion system protein ImpL
MLYRFFHSRWVETFIGLLVLSVLVWFFGPLLGVGEAHPLDSVLARATLIAVMVVFWLVLNLLRELSAAKKEKSLVEGVAAGPDPDQVASDEEVALLAGRLREAIHTLKKSKLGGKSSRRLYQLPWYMFIGPPGAGKTTALANCGLQFPLAETGKGGALAMAGVGGTRNCDWWFTDQAVLIDTAGRYTTQDSHAPVDAAAWSSFLRLLKKHRTRQPLNGVIVAISLSDLSLLNDDERAAHARAVRRRVRELNDELGVRIPVYVLFTKADLIAGFVEFFDGLDREAREQVWGMTFPLDKPGDAGGAVAGFGAEFDLLLARLNDRMLERVNAETDILRRRLIYGFPQQVASLRDVATEFLDEIFRPSKLEARPLLRGVYLASGTQDGTPIDRLLGTMAGQFGLGRQSVVAFSGAGKSFFLSRLVRDVIFREAGLVSKDPKVERRARWIQLGVFAAAAVFLLLVTGFWTLSYFGNSAMIAQVQSESATYNAQYKELLARPPGDTDLAAILPALHTLRTIRGGYDDREQSAPLTLTFGLYQGHKLTSAAVGAYYRALNALLLPRLLARLETQMQGHIDKPDFLYSALKIYLILGRQGPLDSGLVLQWLQADFEGNFPGDENADMRDALLSHVEAMMQQPLTAIPLNGPLVAQVRGILTQQPLAEYSYNRMIHSRRIRDLPEWTVADNAGPGASRVFQLRSGHKLSTGVPGIFTHAGYHSTFLPLLPTVTQDITEDGWVLGLPDRGVTGNLAETNKLRRDVLGLYLDDYVRVWDALLADIAIKPFGNIAAGVDELNLLSAPDSPLRDLMQSVDVQTQLSRSGASDKLEAGAEAKLAKVGSKASGFAKVIGQNNMSGQEAMLGQVLGEAFGNDATTGKPIDPATRVDEHFKWVHDFVTGKDGEPAPMEAAITKIQAMYQNLNQVAGAANPGAALLSAAAGGGGGGGGAGGGGGGGAGAAAAQLQTLAKDLPKPVAEMLKTVSQSGSAVASSGASAALQDSWRSKVLPLCNEAFNRYPFVAGSSADVPLDDFTRLLGPAGLIDTFFNDNLKSLVDTSKIPWHWQSADHVQLGLSPGTLIEFQRAAEIRDALFANGSTIQVKFTLVPASLDTGVAKITLDISGQTMTYDHGPTESTGFVWPGANGKTLVRVTMISASGGHETVIEKDGPWSLLRLMEAGRVIPSGQPDSFKLIFNSPSGAATFTLNASSVRNPFTLSAMRSFRCPAKL